MSRRLAVLVFASDRQVLRHLARPLAAFGYEVHLAAERRLALAEIEGRRPHFLLLDSEPDLAEALALCREASAPDRDEPFVFLMAGDPTAQELAEALQAGVDDFLGRPVVYGELLARLRAAARVLEFERRLRRQSGADPLTGLPDRTAFMRQLERRLAPPSDPLPPAACVLADIDLLGRINHVHGWPAGDAVIRAAADALGKDCGDGSLASLGGGRFAILRPGESDEEAGGWAERVRAGLAQTDAAFGPLALRFTASLGVADSRGARTAAEVLAWAEAALLAAKHSGRDCVVRSGEKDAPMAAWPDFTAPGKLFDRTTARDVMAPCTVLLRADQTMAEAAEIVSRGPAGPVPVVRPDGTLAGALFPEELSDSQAGADTATIRVGDVMAADVPRYDETASFAALRDFFTQDDRPAVVVVRQDRPVGLVTPDHLAALTARLDTDTFAPPEFSPGADYLRVGDLRPL